MRVSAEEHAQITPHATAEQGRAMLVLDRQNHLLAHRLHRLRPLFELLFPADFLTLPQPPSWVNKKPTRETP